MLKLILFFICILSSHHIVFLFLFFVLANAENVPQLLISSYSQVSRSGSNRHSEGRSNGQKPWTQSTDAHVVRGQNLEIRKQSDRRNALGKNEKIITGTDVIGPGEVIQERFNPKPWFGYELEKNRGPAYIPPDSSKQNTNKQPSDFTVSVPFDSFPLSLKPSNTNAPSSLLKPPFNTNDMDMISPGDEDSQPLNNYDSPYSSYNPNPKQITTSPNNFVTKPEYFPPNEDDTPPLNTYGSPYNSYNPNPKQTKPVTALPHSFVTKSEPEITMSKYNSLMDTSVKYLPANFDKPEGENKEYEDNAHETEHYFPSSSPDHIKYDFQPEDLQTPSDNGQHFQGYSFDHHIHNHPPVYYEVKTTTAAPEKQRLNKRPYSYYYLGRKLYYIPLYFSVYFIIYVFVLILKSIARHKITFSQYFEEDKREMKNVEEMHHEHVEEVENHVYHNIEAAKRKYII